MEGYRYARSEMREELTREAKALRAEAARRWALVSKEPALPHARIAADADTRAASLEVIAASLNRTTSAATEVIPCPCCGSPADCPCLIYEFEGYSNETGPYFEKRCTHHKSRV